jgi:hypothetical protein
MLSFIENTWLIWWLLAIVVIIRWFHGAVEISDLGSDSEEYDRMPALGSSKEFSAITGKEFVTRTYQRS